MSFITFIYRIGNNPKTYYGKYNTNYISDDHNGLDSEVKHVLKKGINDYRIKNNMQKIKSKIMIGILSLSSDKIIPITSTKNEIKCFNFYYTYVNKVYINGKLI